MANSDIELRITARDETRAGLAQADRNLKGWASSARKEILGVNQAISLLKAGIVGLLARQTYRLLIKPAIDQQELRSQLSFLTRNVKQAEQQIRIAMGTGAQGVGQGAKALLAGGQGLGQLQNLSQLAVATGQEVGKVVAQYLGAQKDILAGKRPDVGGMGISQAAQYRISQASGTLEGISRFNVALTNAAKASEKNMTDAQRLAKAQADLNQKLADAGSKLLPAFVKLVETLSQFSNQIVAVIGTLGALKAFQWGMAKFGGGQAPVVGAVGATGGATGGAMVQNLRQGLAQSLTQAQVNLMVNQQLQKASPLLAVPSGPLRQQVYAAAQAVKVAGSFQGQQAPVGTRINQGVGMVGGAAALGGQVALMAAFSALAINASRVSEALQEMAAAAERIGANVEKGGGFWRTVGQTWFGLKDEMTLATKKTSASDIMADRQRMNAEKEAQLQLDLERKMQEEAPGAGMQARDVGDVALGRSYQILKTTNESAKALDELYSAQTKINEITAKYGDLIPVDSMTEIKRLSEEIAGEIKKIEEQAAQWAEDLQELQDRQEAINDLNKEYVDQQKVVTELAKKELDIRKDIAEFMRNKDIQENERKVELLQEQLALIEKQGEEERKNLELAKNRLENAAAEVDRLKGEFDKPAKQRRAEERAKRKATKEYADLMRRGEQAIENEAAGRSVSEKGKIAAAYVQNERQRRKEQEAVAKGEMSELFRKPQRDVFGNEIFNKNREIAGQRRELEDMQRKRNEEDMFRNLRDQKEAAVAAAASLNAIRAMIENLPPWFGEGKRK